jgi:hypothetical protein
MAAHSAPQPREQSDEQMRGLAAPGPSKVGVHKAMRARDVSRVQEPAVRRPAEPSGQSDGGAGSSGSSPDRS